jgi:hypothetical protein
MKRSRRKIISLRNTPEQLELEWNLAVVRDLGHNARYYKAMLALKPNITRVLDIWFKQRDDFDLFVKGTSDPDLYAERKSALEERERNMAGLLQQIIDLCEERGAEGRS